MKLMIASDLHGSAYYTHQLLDAWDREGAPRLFLLGDILYHGPRNDLPEGYAPKEVLAMLNERRDRIFCVRGASRQCGATATPRWIRWCWTFPSWQIMRC